MGFYFSTKSRNQLRGPKPPSHRYIIAVAAIAAVAAVVVAVAAVAPVVTVVAVAAAVAAAAPAVTVEQPARILNPESWPGRR